MCVELLLNQAINSKSELFNLSIEEWCDKYKKHAMFFISFYPLYDSGNSVSDIEEAISNEMSSICIRSSTEVPLFRLLVMLDKTFAFTPSKLIRQMGMVVNLINSYRKVINKYNSIPEHNNSVANSILIHLHPALIYDGQYSTDILSKINIDIFNNYENNLNEANHAIKQLKSIYTESSSKTHSNPNNITYEQHSLYTVDITPPIFKTAIINEIIRCVTEKSYNISNKIKLLAEKLIDTENGIHSMIPEICEYMLAKYRYKLLYISFRKYKQPPFNSILSGFEHIYDKNKSEFIDQLSLAVIDILITMFNNTNYIKVFELLTTHSYIGLASERIDTNLYKEVYKYLENHNEVKNVIISQFDITTLINIEGEK